MKRNLYNLLLAVSALCVCVGVALSIWYAVSFYGSEGYEGNLFDFVLYTGGMFIAFLYGIILRRRFVTNYTEE